MNVRRILALFIAAGALIFLSGCATITRGTKDTLIVESDPAGADVRLSTGQTGKTPTSFKLSRSEPLVVTISKEGYETLNVSVNPQVVGAGAAGMAGNVLVGGLIGAGVDAYSGAMKDLKPNPVSVKMVKLESHAAPAAPAAPATAPAAPATTPTPTSTASAAPEARPPAAAGSSPAPANPGGG
jgi:hypothetical protein